MKNTQAPGWASVTGRMTLAQSSPVMTWNRLSRELGRSPKCSGSVEPNMCVDITPHT